MAPNDKVGRPVFWASLVILVVLIFIADQIPNIKPTGSILTGMGVALGMVISVLILGWLAWQFRMNCRTWYGLLEIFVAFWAVFSTIVSDSGGIRTVVGLLAAIYVVVRGLDNLDEGHKHRDPSDSKRRLWERVRRKTY